MNIVRDAGREIVGRTRLQKTAYFLEVTGVGDGFVFWCRNFGPCSEGVAAAANGAVLKGELSEDVKTASWGGDCSIYSVDLEQSNESPEGRRKLAPKAAESSSIELELAATAVFLKDEGHGDPRKETQTLKEVKCEQGRLDRAKRLLAELKEIEVPNPLPDFG